MIDHELHEELEYKDFHQKQSEKYRELLKLVGMNPYLNNWEKGFMQTICNSNTLNFSSKQREIILNIAVKSKQLNSNMKTLLRIWMDTYK